MQAGRPSPDEPIIGPLSKSGMTNWGWRHLTPAAKRITGREDVTLYTFRHSHASALHYCGHTAPLAARRLGHSIQVHWGYHAHVVEALGGQPKYADLDELIAEARASREDVSAELMFPAGSPGSP
jgi:integrase